jgi:hypothetical protein
MNEFEEKARKAFEAATLLFPEEKWVYKEANIYVAKSRLREEYQEKDKWEREMSQVRILTSQGSVAYFLPEYEKKGETGKMCADLVLDGTIVELKTVAGTRETLGHQFRLGYKQGASLIHGRTDIQEHSVFIRLFSDLSVGSVKAKIAGELKDRSDPGSFICYFEIIGELYTWTYEELRALIGKK